MPGLDPGIVTGGVAWKLRQMPGSSPGMTFFAPPVAAQKRHFFAGGAVLPMSVLIFMPEKRFLKRAS